MRNLYLYKIKFTSDINDNEFFKFILSNEEEMVKICPEAEIIEKKLGFSYSEDDNFFIYAYNSPQAKELYIKSQEHMDRMYDQYWDEWN